MRPEGPDEATRASGLLVTSTCSAPRSTATPATGRSACSGYWFENVPEPAYPVTEITVAGNLLDIYKRLVPGSDLTIRGSADAPSILIDALAIAGK